MEVSAEEVTIHFPELLDKIALGEEVIIERDGKPIAKLVPVEHARNQRILGQARGEIIFSPGWDDPMTEEELAEFGA